MADTGRRMYFEEFSKLLRRNVTVVTTDGRKYSGNLEGYNPETMSVCLINVKDDKGKETPNIFFSGNMVSQVFVSERPFNMKGLSERLEKVFPKMVKFYEDAGVIVVMDRIRVGPNGILEGTGPMAERVQRVYDEFMRETKTQP
ncbi:Lsm family RNA-binding protein [Candidatus Bathyarchaeota archaeon]|nr:Lsm family RNA-binding protein [Candidatus Bathyarchaeota archaeon]